MPEPFELVVELAGLPPAKNSRAPLAAQHQHLNRSRALLAAVRLKLPPEFSVLTEPVGLEVTVRTSRGKASWDATNYLGGIADVLQVKDRGRLAHLGELAAVAVYANDRLIKEVLYRHERAVTVSYRVRVWSLDRADLLDGPCSPSLMVLARPARSRSPTICIDFVNTLIGRGQTSSVDELRSYHDLLDWAESAGVVDQGTRKRLLARADACPVEAGWSLRDAVRFREAISRGLTVAPSESDLEDLNELRSRFLQLRHLVWDQEARRAKWVTDEMVYLSDVLAPIAQSFESLIEGELLGRVRACAGCNQLFVDTSKNNQRRWCDMSDCGNREKARRFHQRRKAAALS